jgi:hypothetical protein
MGIKHDILQDICSLAISQVQDLYPTLRLMFIPHEDGRLHEVVALSEHEVMRHPAGKIAQTILDKNNNRDLSSFLGLAIHQKPKWFGLASEENILALFNINIDEFSDPKDTRRAVYHLIWHAIDLLEIRQRPEYAAKFRKGPMIPKRSPMNLARLNLQADVFSAVLAGLQGEEDALDTLALKRARDSILPVHARRAEDYPFVVGLESAKYAYDAILSSKPVKSKYMRVSRQLALEIGRTYDDKSIRRWWQFSEPAQDMAWRNVSAENILGCAVFTSDDAFVRANGHLVADTSGITPTPATKLGDGYNAYASQERNQILHREMVERTFEEAIAKGVREESGQPLIAAANEQNENLAEGNILGWCAHALQAAARAFEGAHSTGISPAQAARLEFEGTKDSTPWESLKRIGESIIEKKRQGLAVTLGSIAEIANNNPAYAPVLGSIRVTMKDPGYIQKLEAANDFALRGPAANAPSGPAPAAAAPKAPAPAAPAFSMPMPMPYPGPGMGMGGHSSHAAARHNAIMERLRREQQSPPDNDKQDT